MRRLILLLLLIGLGAAALGIWTAQRSPQVVRYSLEMPGLAAPLRIVQLSDSHASRWDMPPERLARVVEQINALKPDMILLTGDYVSGNPDRWNAVETRAALAPFDRLGAPLGVFAVLGNHDDPIKTAAGFRPGPVKLLVGQRVDAGPLQIVGVDDIARGSPAVETMRGLIASAPQDKPLLVIVHRPTFVEWLQTRPVLMIAGHTHGGQFKLPILGAWATDAFYAAHQRGVFRQGIHRLLVSSGLGTTNIPMRIGVPPEIVELTLQPGRNSGTDK